MSNIDDQMKQTLSQATQRTIEIVVSMIGRLKDHLIEHSAEYRLGRADAFEEITNQLNALKQALENSSE